MGKLSKEVVKKFWARKKSRVGVISNPLISGVLSSGCGRLMSLLVQLPPYEVDCSVILACGLNPEPRLLSLLC